MRFLLFFFFPFHTGGGNGTLELLVSHLKGTVDVSGEFDQLLLHRLADGAAVAVQGHAVHQQETEERKRGSVKYSGAAVRLQCFIREFSCWGLL